MPDRCRASTCRPCGPTSTCPRDFPADGRGRGRARSSTATPTSAATPPTSPLVTVDPPGVDGPRPGPRTSRPAATGGASTTPSPTWAPSSPPGGAVDAESWLRGETLYLPDGRVPLHPTPLSEGAASLLPGPGPAGRAVAHRRRRRRASSTDVVVERAVVRSRSRHDLRRPAGRARRRRRRRTRSPHLPALGQARRRPCPCQGRDRAGPALAGGRRARRTATGRSRSARPCRSRRGTRRCRCSPAWPRPELMLDAGVGLLRTLPPPDAGRRPPAAPGRAGARRRLARRRPARRRPRRAATPAAHGTPPSSTWPARCSGARATPPSTASRPPSPATPGSGRPTPTSPRRSGGSCDRFATEVCLAVDRRSGRCPSGPGRRSPPCPTVMAESGRRARAVERAAIDHVEAWLLAARVGEVFDVAVVEHDEERDRSHRRARRARRPGPLRRPAAAR